MNPPAGDYNERGERVMRVLVWAVPFLMSLALSLTTVGNRVYWQDSGIFLSAVHDAGILYPPGFVLYVVFCKTWTWLFFFLDFTLAVHLFSSACVAGTAAILSVAVRDFLRSKGELFKVDAVDDPDLAAWCGIAAGSMAAGGFTFWFTGIYAKGYAFYYLILALLLWRMIRADETRAPRDFGVVAGLIGLAWAAHPSAASLALVLVLYVVFHRKTVGGRAIARNVGIAAAAALAPSLTLLPLLAMRGPVTALGDPRSLTELLDYAFGLRFMGRPGAFGPEHERLASFGLFLWEDFLGVGLVLLTVGLVSLVGPNRRLLLGILCWVLPYSALAILFKVEGQHDCWFVAAWLPLHLMVGLGLSRVAQHLPLRARGPVAASLALLSLVWAFRANHDDLDQRRYEFAGDYGRILLDNLDKDAILILNGDDSLAICGYQQRVRNVRPDVTVVAQPFLGLSLVSERDWYDQKLLREKPFLRMPDYPGTRARLPGARPLAAHLAAFLHANAGLGRPIFSQTQLPGSMLPQGTTFVPAGVLWKLVPLGDRVLNLDYWRFPVQPEDIQGRVGRSRGLNLVRRDGRLEGHAEPYENRLIDLLLKGRVGLAEVYVLTGRPAEALALLDTVRLMEPSYEARPDFLATVGHANHALGRDKIAEDVLRKALRLGLPSGARGWAYYSLGEIHEKRGKPAEAEEMFAEASTASGGDPRLQELLARRFPPPD